MANNNKQTELKSTEEHNYKMRRSFSWDRAFFTSDGFLAPEELTSMIEGGRNDVKLELESMEAKMFQELEASTKKYASCVTSSSINLSSEKRDIKIRNVIAADGPHNNVKTLERKGMTSKNGKANVDSPAKTPPDITTKTKVGSINTRISSPTSPGSSSSKNSKANANSPLKTPQAIKPKNKVGSVDIRVSRISPVSPRSSSSSSSSTFSVNQRPKWNSSVRCESLANNDKLVTTHGRRNDDRKSSKPAVDLMPKSQSSIGSKIKPPPESLPSLTKPTSKKHPNGTTNGSNATRLPSIKTETTTNTGLKPKSPKTITPKKQSKGMESVHVISPEILDLKGKLNALKMEINIQKDRCSKMVRVESGKAICY